MSRGGFAEAETALRSAVAVEDATGLTVWAAHSRVALARMLRRSGAPADAEPRALPDQMAATTSRAATTDGGLAPWVRPRRAAA